MLFEIYSFFILFNLSGERSQPSLCSCTVLAVALVLLVLIVGIDDELVLRINWR